MEAFFDYLLAFTRRGLEWGISMFAQSLWGSFGQSIVSRSCHSSWSKHLPSCLFVSAQNQTISKAARIAPFDLLPKVSETVTHFIKDQSDYSQASRRALFNITFLVCKYQTTFRWWVVCIVCGKTQKPSKITWQLPWTLKIVKTAILRQNHGRVLLQTVIVYWCALSEEVAIKC